MFKNNQQGIKILFMGTPEFGAIVLEKLSETNLKPVLVVTAPDKPVGRKQIVTPPPVKVSAEKLGIKTLQPESIKTLKLETKPDLIIVSAFGQIIPDNILNAPQHGSLNLHPSLLPSLRGPSPIQSAILEGDEKTGVSIIKITEKVDAGPILSQKEVNLEGNETYLTLNNKLAELGAELLIETIPKWLEGEIKPKPQEESKATYTRIIKKQDGEIDWKEPAQAIERKIRGLDPWPGAYTIFKNKRLKILKAEVSGDKLLVRQIQPEGKNPMNFDDFLRGYPDFSKNKEICSRILI